MQRIAERSASFKPSRSRRPTIADWPTPDELALFDALDKLHGDKQGKKKDRAAARLSSFGFDAAVAVAVALCTFGFGVGVANALTALPLSLP